VARYAASHPAGARTERLRCGMCGHWWARAVQGGREPRWCSDRCKQRAYRDRDTAAAAWASERARRDRVRGRAEPQADGWDEAEWESWWRRATAPPPAGPQYMTAGQARAELLRLAGVAGVAVEGLSLRKVYRLTAKRLHPDAEGDPEVFKLLSVVKHILDEAGLL
jgi:hypothetical protein